MPHARARSDVADSVIRGETSLVEAAKSFRELSGSDPQFVQRMSVDYPDADEIELFARSVLFHVRVHLRGKEDGAAIVARLQDELTMYIHQSKSKQSS